MFDRLEDLVIRLEEVLSELQEPDVASDMNRFRKLMKEQNELTPIVEAYKAYKEIWKFLLYIRQFDFALNFFHNIRGLTFRYSFIPVFLSIISNLTFAIGSKVSKSNFIILIFPFFAITFRSLQFISFY